ncbi:MAG: response regulator [Elusimicrobia bacterium]|nr:response regulator [Elusimicrobiota bacterium]
MKKIMIVDDDHGEVRLLESRLSKEGFAVSHAENGEDGLALLKKDRPDLIVLDVEMPKMNGYTFIIEMRKDPDCADLPVIVLTSHSENQAIFQRRGIASYLVKPVNFNLLIPKIHAALAPKES